MNKTYLSKLIEQETINVKIQLIKEHIEIARGEHIQLLENAFKADRGLLSEQTETDTTTWPEKTAKTQEFLKRPSLHASEETRGSNLVAYDVTVKIPAGGEQKQSYKNLFTFYEDGSVYDFNLMGRFGYEYDDSKKLITIMSKNPAALVSLADSKPLATIDSKGKFTNLAYAEQPKSTFDKPKEMPWLDTLQTVLDFAGLIPVIGDALDVINAIIYFWREKYFEGFLSLIAIIPVVGSVISLGVKGAFKGIKTAIGGSKILSKVGASNLVGRWWLKGDPKAIKELADKLLATGAITARQLRDIEKAFGSFGKLLKKAGKSVPTDVIPGGSAVAKALDNAGITMSKGAKGFDDAIKAVSKAADVGDTAKVAATIWKTPTAVANFLTGGLLPRIKKMPWFPTKQLAAMGVKTQDRFVKKIAQSPEKLGLLTKFGGVKQRKVVSDEFASFYRKFGKAGAKGNKKNLEAIDDIFKGNDELIKLWKQDGASIDWDGMLQSADKTQDFFTALKNSDPKLAAEFGKTLTDQAVAKNNILWNTYKESTANKIISSQSANVLKTSFAKNVDWIWNELQMAGETAGMGTLGFESSEHLGKVGIIPLTKWAVASSMPGTYASMQATRDAIVSFVKPTKDILNVAANTLGFQISTLEEYPPLGAEQYSYKQDEE
jgi:hypothetical protein